ncbi:PLC-like phosphodiesterase, TIM beta/alpha-barrel domain protein [Moelleriella libera RCEF 2490]|uniref:PLC-like phosphodiesterase, TIM beta/alpha-barrel domain protein n=1 Tax=Moelleriella libera RCEF 2490 TaxID=1081109 RepID=A0A166UJ91_9HYPO|nr:PLC-like phosphodiesterase, TIM beta/alpha-barrel domain protein [Moelleriella libera RCEF 2490]
MFRLLRTFATAALVAASTVRGRPQDQTSSTTTTGASNTACNNSPSLCGKQYNAITHMGAHNSAFLRDASTGNSVSGNQFLNATAALDAGLRLLQAQVHKPNSTLELCHTTCGLLDAGSLEAWLAKINTWVVAHPNDVVTVLLVNSDSAPMTDFATAYTNSGLAKVAYKPAAGSSLTANWPTLQSMIGANTRVVSFVTNADYAASAPFLLPEFDHVFETPFEVSAIGGFNCSVNRPSRASPASSSLASGYMSLVNHFKYQSVLAGLEIPDVSSIDTVNSAATSAAGNLGKHLQDCKAEWNKQPNFVLVDFWNRGDPIAALDSMNAVTDATGRSTAKAGSQSQGSAALGDRKLGTYGALVAFVAAALLLV